MKNVDAEASTSGSSGKVSFTLENTGGADATATAIVVNSTSTDAVEVSEGNPRLRTTDDNTALVTQDISIGNTQYEFNSDVTIPAGSEVPFEFNKFRRSPGPGRPNVDMAGEDITITIYFGDGSTGTFTINVPN